MPSLNTKRQVRYIQADENALAAVVNILEFAQLFDPEIKQDAGTGLTALKHVTEHVAKKRKPVEAAKE